MGMAPTFLYTSLNGANNFFAKANRHNAATLLNFHDLCISSNEQLFDKILILTCPDHILQTLLPPSTAQNYTLRNRPHNRELPGHISQLMDCDYIVRMLYHNVY